MGNVIAVRHQALHESVVVYKAVGLSKLIFKLVPQILRKLIVIIPVLNYKANDRFVLDTELFKKGCLTCKLFRAGNIKVLYRKLHKLTDAAF